MQALATLSVTVCTSTPAPHRTKQPKNHISANMVLFFKMADETNVVKATGVLTHRDIVHGHKVLLHHVVVLVKEVLDESLKPFVPNALDEDEFVMTRAFYQWPLKTNCKLSIK